MATDGDNLLPYGGELYYYPDVFSRTQSENYMRELLTAINWKQEPIKIFGRQVMQPRLTAWYGDITRPYAYSGITMLPTGWIQPLLEIKSIAEQYSGDVSTSALLNLYRDGNDHLGWHRDNEKVLGTTPTIASVSFGAARTFQLRSYKEKNDLISLELQPGSIVIMKGASQQQWEHRIPKSKKTGNARINITFRNIG